MWCLMRIFFFLHKKPNFHSSHSYHYSLLTHELIFHSLISPRLFYLIHHLPLQQYPHSHLHLIQVLLISLLHPLCKTHTCHHHQFPPHLFLHPHHNLIQVLIIFLAHPINKHPHCHHHHHPHSFPLTQCKPAPNKALPNPNTLFPLLYLLSLQLHQSLPLISVQQMIHTDFK